MGGLWNLKVYQFFIAGMLSKADEMGFYNCLGHLLLDRLHKL